MLDKNLEHFRNLISLAMADGKLCEPERVYLSKIAYDRGIPMERMNIMLAHANEYSLIIPQNQVERDKQLDEMIQFALIDNEFAKSERDLILTVGQRLGFNAEEVNGRIERHLVTK